MTPPLIPPCGHFDLRLLQITQLELAMKELEKGHAILPRKYPRLDGRLPIRLMEWLEAHPGSPAYKITEAFHDQPGKRVRKCLSQLKIGGQVRAEGDKGRFVYFTGKP